MKVAEFTAKLQAHLATVPAGEGRVEAAAMAISQLFQVQPEEVAFLLLAPDVEELRFAWPKRLRSSGSVPLSSRESLAARTAREGKAYLNNRFSSTSHTSVFEYVKLQPDQPQLIQKIISAPLVAGTARLGVLQVSRKGSSSSEAGADFVKEDLEALVEVARVTAPLLLPPSAQD